MKIVFLDAKTLGDDIDYTQFEQLGEVVKYPFSSSFLAYAFQWGHRLHNLSSNSCASLIWKELHFP